MNSSLSDHELRRLGTLLSAEKASLTRTELEEKARLRDMWQRERLHLSDPFDLWIDWWLDDETGAASLKTWAAKQLVIDIARPLLQSLRSLRWEEDAIANCLQRTAKVEGLPFYFDSDSNSQNTPRDTGFGLFTLRQLIKSSDSMRPLLELAAFIGLQRFRPTQVGREKRFRFALWSVRLPVNVANIPLAGLLAVPQQRFEFRMLYRSQYMKAFLPARRSQGD